MVRGKSLERSMSHYLVQQIAALPNVEVRTGAQAVAAEGKDGHLHTLTIRAADATETVEQVDACFVFIGASRRQSSMRFPPAFT